MASAFFYGTLVHPDVLRRVLANDAAHLSVAPALLPGYTRHHVKACDYPAIAPAAATRALRPTDSPPDPDPAVRGTLVAGLTPVDLALLDVFEGDEYSRKTVSVVPLAPFSPLAAAHAPALLASAAPLPIPALPPVSADTYVWADALTRLTPDPWSFDTFVRERLWRWVGRGSADNPDYAVVDARRALNGRVKATAPAEQPESSPPAVSLPEFGHALLPQFCFHKDYINLNNGSFGVVPRPVLDATDALTREIEARPDAFFRRTYFARSAAVRAQLARLLGAQHLDEVVLVPNATHGINTILRAFEWAPGDVIVSFSTTYGAIARTLQYLHDVPPYPTLATMRLVLPASHEDIVHQFRAYLRAVCAGIRAGADNDDGTNTEDGPDGDLDGPLSPPPGPKIVVVLDGITSNPGCLLPWEALVRVCRAARAWSIVDAAHCVGQQTGLQLARAAPDFWISNCHKWLFTKRGCAVLYVPRRNQHIIRTSFPTSFGYVSPADADAGGEATNFVSGGQLNFVGQFEYNGTLDFVPYLSVHAALEFRESLGGEERINDYCHALALRGGRRIAQLLQTDVLDKDGSLTVNMTNVRLPLPVTPGQDVNKMRLAFEDKLLQEWDCFVAVYAYEGKWWARCSAQVWNEMSDFDHVAKALAAVCAELRQELGV